MNQPLAQPGETDTDNDVDARTYYDRIRPLVESYAASLPVTRVAVVGNQPLSRSAERAMVIDGSDLIFRVNGFRVDTSESGPCVGTRTDVVVFNRGVRATPWFFAGYTGRLYLLIEPGRLRWENESIPAFWPTDLGFITVPNREVILPLNDTIGLDARGAGLWATTGTTMLWMASHLFPEAQLHATGFSFVDEPTQKDWNHAYGEPSAVGAEHRIRNESDLVRAWIDNGRIMYHR
ncbi:hypothetical protein [Microbacterium sp. NPDC055455]